MFKDFCICGRVGAYSQTISRVDTIEYSDNLTVWVLGQVERTTTNGVEVSRTDYDTTTALPTATCGILGNFQQGMTYNTNGTVATVEDGNNNVTRFSSYKRGIPQRMDLPATPDQPSGTYITANVDDLAHPVGDRHERRKDMLWLRCHGPRRT